MSNKVNISWNECEALITDIFEKAGASRDDAALVADHLTSAEAQGATGHGISRVKSYHAQLVSGKINNSPQVKEHNQGALVELDADCGLAYVAIEKAIALSSEIASQQGACIVSIANSHHAGVLGLYVERLARMGYMALMMANSPAAMAPWGGKKPIFGTNPIAMACPYGEDPLIIDLSLSKVARGKVMRAANEGTDIPEGWGIDANGNHTTDPKAVLEGSMLPAGDMKGAMLALIVEIMTAGLARSHYGFQASSFFHGEGDAPRVAQTLMVFSPSNPAGTFDHIAFLLNEMAKDDGVRIPGQAWREKREAAKRDGINILASDLEVLKSL